MRTTELKSSGSAPSYSKGGAEEELKRQTRALIDECKREIAQSKRSVSLARLNFEIAHAYDTILGSPRQALKHYHKSMEFGPEYLPAIRNARRLHLTSRSYEEAISLFDAEIRLVGDAHTKALLYLHKGRVLEDLMKQQRQALECYAKGVELDPENTSLLRAMAQVEFRIQDWTALAKTLKKTANATRDSGHRAAVIIERAKITETRLHNSVLAAELYKSAAAADPKASGAFASLKRLLYSQSRWKDLIEVLEGEIASAQDTKFQETAFLTIGRVYAEYLGERDRAIEALTRGVQIVPESTAVWELLALQIEEKGDTKALVEVLKNCSEKYAEPLEKLGILHRIGSLLEIELSEPDAAINWYQAALAHSPTYLPSLHALSRLYAERQNWDSLINMHLACASAADNAVRAADAHAKVAEIYEIHMHDLQEATSHYAQALKLVPKMEHVFKALERLYEGAGRYSELVDLLESAAVRAKEQDKIAYYLMRIGFIWEHEIKNPVRAAHAYRRILKSEPSHLGALHALQRTLENAGRYKELVPALEAELELENDVDAKKALMLRVGEILEEKVESIEEALICYKKILNLDETYLPVLSRLGNLYQRIERWDDLIDIFEKELKIATHKSAQVVLLHKMGELCETRLGDEGRAIAYYKRAVDLDSTYKPTTSALAKRFRERGDYDSLVEVLDKKFQGARDVATKVHAACELGEIEEVHRKALLPAGEAFKKAIDLASDYRPALDGFYRVYSQIADWTDLVNTLMREASTVRNEQMAVDALLRAADIYAHYLDNNKMAITIYETVLDKQPKNLSALLALEPIYRETAAWIQLADVLRSLEEIFEEKHARIGVLLEIARLLESRRLNRDDDLADTYRKILALDGEHPLALAGLERIAVASNNRDLLVEVDQHYIGMDQDGALSAVYNTRYGLSVESRNLFDAIAAYRQALSQDPHSLTAIFGLKRLADIVNDPLTMTIALKYEADWTTDHEVAADILVKNAFIKVRKLHDNAGAIADAALALERCPDHADAAKILTELMMEENRVDELIDALRRAADATKDLDRRSKLLGSVGRLYVDVKNDVASCIDALLRLKMTSPDDIPNMQQLAACYKQNTNWAEAIDVMEKIVTLSSDTDVLVETFYEMAQISKLQLKDLRKTRNYLNALLKLAADHWDGLALLVDIHLKQGNYKSAEQTAEKLLQLARTPAERTVSLEHLGYIEREKGKIDTALEYWGRAVELNGPVGNAAKEYCELAATADDWVKYEQALLRYQETLMRGDYNTEELLGVVLARAGVQQEKLGSRDKAIATLQNGLSITGGRPELRYALSKLLVLDKRYDEAIREYKIILNEDSSQVEAWRCLGDTLLLRGEKREAAIVYGPLTALGEADSRERKIAKEMAYASGSVRPGVLRRENLKRIGKTVPGDEIIVELFDSMTEAMIRLYPREFEKYQEKGTVLPAYQFDRNFQLFCARLGEIFDVEHCEVYVIENEGADIDLEFSDPISIFIPAWVTMMVQAEQAFLLSKVFAIIASGLFPVFKLGTDECAMLLEAAAYKYVSGYQPYRFDVDQVEDLARKLIKATSRKGRRALEDAALRYGRGPRADVADCAMETEIASLRAAALVAGDLQAVTEVIRRSNHELSLYRGSELVQNSPALSDLFRFWISSEASVIRSQMGRG